MARKQGSRKKWDAKDYGWTAGFFAVVAALALNNAFDTYNSTGGYDPTIGAYAEHGDATMSFIIGGALAVIALFCGLIAAIAKGNQVGSPGD